MITVEFRCKESAAKDAEIARLRRDLDECQHLLAAQRKLTMKLVLEDLGESTRHFAAGR